MTGPMRQRGGLLIITVVLIVTIGLLATVLPVVFVSETRSMLDQARSEEAFVIAESGLQRGIRQWKLNPSTYTNEGPVTFGGGNFTITVLGTDFSGATLPTGQKRIRSVGQVASVQGNVSRTTEAIVALNGAAVSDPFPSLADFTTNWVTSYDATGALIHDATNTAPSSIGGSMYIWEDATLSEQIFKGQADRTLLSPIAGGTSVTLNLWYRTKKGTPQPDEMKAWVHLVDTTGTAYNLWNYDSVANVNWSSASSTRTLPTGRTFTKLRVQFQLKNGNGPASTTKVPIEMWVDEISLSTGSGPSQIMQWRETVF
ncbi:MAG: hypothetical protein AB1810_11400 [Pseudomonadota bacterium]